MGQTKVPEVPNVVIYAQSLLLTNFRDNGERANTPASGDWNLSAVYLHNSETEFKVLYVNFSTTGKMDMLHPEHEQAHALLSPSIRLNIILFIGFFSLNSDKLLQQHTLQTQAGLLRTLTNWYNSCRRTLFSLIMIHSPRVSNISPDTQTVLAVS
jgi:hypothetical protein